MVTLPEPFASIPRQELLFPHPAPIEALDRLVAKLVEPQSPPTRLFVKREDANSGLGGGGGNKIRKLEYVLADALAQNPKPTHLITAGGIQSNHVRHVAAAGAKLGFSSTLLIHDMVPERSGEASVHNVEYTTLGNVQVTDLMSAAYEDGAKVSPEDAASRDGGYWISPGASTHPLGGLGYARWAFEVEEQERNMDIHFDVVVVPLGSGSTLGGMVAGFKLAERLREKEGRQSRPRRVVGVTVYPPPDVEELRNKVMDIARKAAGLIGLEDDAITAGDFEIDNRWNAGAYGRLDKKTKGYVKLAASTEGLLTEPVYTGKALTGLCESVRAQELHGNILYVHTGGVLSLSAYPDLR